MIAFAMFIVGFVMAVGGAMGVDAHDVRHGIRDMDARGHAYGSSISFVWPWTPLAWLGMLMCVASPFVAAGGH